MEETFVDQFGDYLRISNHGGKLVYVGIGKKGSDLENGVVLNEGQCDRLAELLKGGIREEGDREDDGREGE